MILPLLALLAATARAEPLRAALADKHWAVQIDPGEMDLRENEAIADGSSTRLLATREKDGLTLSITLEKMPDLRSAKACRDYYWGRLKRGNDGKTDVKLSDSRGAARVEYAKPDFEGIKILQKHIHAYLWKDGVCADTSLIMVGYKSADQKGLEAIVKTLKLVKTP